MGYTVYGILQARILEQVAFPFSRGSSGPRDQTLVSHIADGFFTSWATRQAENILDTSKLFQNSPSQASTIHELWTSKLPFRKGKGTRDQIANIHWIIKKAREFQKNICFCFLDYAKAFDCMDHNKLWKILKKMGIPDHLTCLFWNLYAGEEATVRTGHGTTDRFQIGKGVHQGCILSPCLFNLNAEYIMRNTAGRLPGEDCWEKYQQPQICR